MQITANAPRTTPIAGQDVVTYEGDHDRPHSHTTTTFGRGINISYRPLQHHQRTTTRSLLVLTYDNNQVSIKSGTSLRIENYDLIYLHKGPRRPSHHPRRIEGSRTSKYLTYNPKAHLVESPRKLWHRTAATSATSSKYNGDRQSHQTLSHKICRR